jgi:CP family cyanate transporter-like MFS transporter
VSGSRAARRSGGGLVIAAILLATINLRAPITVVGPLVDQIRDEVSLSATAVGLLTTLPVLAFGLASGFAAATGRRFGLEPVLTASALVLAGGLLVRALPGIAPLYAGAAIVGVGIAFANVLIPALIKREFPGRLGPITALYSATLGASAAIGVGVAIPLSTGTFLDWRGTLAVWLAPTLLAAAVLVLLARRGARTHAEPSLRLPNGTFLRSRLAWSVTGFFGLQSFAYFITVAWLPAILIDRGFGAAQAGNLAFLFQLVGIITLLVVPGLAARASDQRALVGAMCAIATAGALGLLLAGTTAVALWMVLLGLGQSAGLGLALMFVVLRTRDSNDASSLSGMSQAAGYIFAAGGPLLAGLLHDITAGWGIVLVMLMGLYVLLLAVGLDAARSAVIGDGEPGLDSR